MKYQPLFFPNLLKDGSKISCLLGLRWKLEVFTVVCIFCQVYCPFFIPKIMQCINFDEHFRKNVSNMYNKFVELFLRN